MIAKDRKILLAEASRMIMNDINHDYVRGNQSLAMFVIERAQQVCKSNEEMQYITDCITESIRLLGKNPEITDTTKDNKKEGLILKDNNFSKN